MVKAIRTEEEWNGVADQILTSDAIIVLTMDDEEPIKKEVMNILKDRCPDVDVVDIEPELYKDKFTGERFAFAPPGIIFFVKGEPVWRSDLGILDLNDHAWNDMILHNMIKKFFEGGK